MATLDCVDDGSGAVRALQIAQAEASPPFAPVSGTERELPAQLVLLAMGFLHPEQHLLEQFGVERDPRGNVKAVQPLHDLRARGLRGRGCSAWTVADRVGDQRGGPVRPDGRPLSPDFPRSGFRGRGLAGHSDADEGPEGPPQHAGPGIGIS